MDISELEYIAGELDNLDISRYSDIESISDYVLNKAQRSQRMTNWTNWIKRSNWTN